MKIFAKKYCENFAALGGFPALEGGLTLPKGWVGSHSELDIVRNREHSSYSFEIKHVYNLEI
jgi:hypothetical protein